MYALNSDGKILQEKKEFKYDKNNNLIETKYYDIDNGLSDTTINKYDNTGNLIESIITNIRSEKYISTYQYKFDKNRN